MIRQLVLITGWILIVPFGWANVFDAVAPTKGSGRHAVITPLATGAVRVECQPKVDWPACVWKFKDPLDLRYWRGLECVIINPDEQPLTVSLRIDASSRPDMRPLQRSTTIPGRATGTVAVTWFEFPVQPEEPLELIGMRGWPGHWSFDPRHVTSVQVFLSKSDHARTFELLAVRPTELARLIPTAQWFPFIDRFGQFRHHVWPGKIRDEQDFAQRRTEENSDLAAHPGPPDRDEWGGWKSGPLWSTSRYFRVTKYQDRWWWVTPSGRLFWSLGVTGVRPSSSTPITDRERYFEWLPEPTSPFSKYYGRGTWAPHGYYTNRAQQGYRTFDFAAANLERKYGENWRHLWVELVLRRLRSWGWNTIANWSDPDVYERRQIPYTGTIHFHSKPIEGSRGYWGKFPDPFDKSFRAGLERALQAPSVRTAIGDPWCLGFFVHNELSWGNHAHELGQAALASPMDQPARAAAIAALKQKYTDLTALNLSWGTSWSHWEEVGQGDFPTNSRVRSDLEQLTSRIAEEYFRVVSEVLHARAPGQLYLGCRFAWRNDAAVRAAAKFCDVISFNSYTETLDGLRLPEGVDKPVIIGEFHFGALDRGMFHTGLRSARDQAERAQKFARYVRSGLRHPNVVGVHWFQYWDQPTTGRADGENYQIGLVDIADTPYPEMREAARMLARELYVLRVQPH